MGTRGPTQLSKQFASIYFQNPRGPNNSAKEAGLILRFREKQIRAACLKETWEHSDDVQENEGYAFLASLFSSPPRAATPALPQTPARPSDGPRTAPCVHPILQAPTPQRTAGPCSNTSL